MTRGRLIGANAVVWFVLAVVALLWSGTRICTTFSTLECWLVHEPRTVAGWLVSPSGACDVLITDADGNEASRAVYEQLGYARDVTKSCEPYRWQWPVGVTGTMGLVFSLVTVSAYDRRLTYEASQLSEHADTEDDRPESSETSNRA
jgi:hypothetical protein